MSKRITMTDNQKSIGVPASVHALAVVLAERQGLKLWETVAEALKVYDRLTAPVGGNNASA